ncbi:thioredoxin reductase (NADPH) [Weissella uvarum]|uniref:thioredoxin-disulfide reductase n=1 Tax=Weissella uvarum TaxID=1479233 RepID=UPI001961972D|nr:thioredoxin-disulfide reductase [Weissella uvarum]MBM7617996.1 thioredoxin reductase (NADPH) [Weissella uvarum]MCM0596215.1 thioredoxin-disulfide reductase [Weissella uvarum]
MTEQFDVVIIGAGPGGMTAATYASRANLSVVMLDRGIYGGQMNNTAEVENYPGYNSILGADLSEKMYASSTQFGAEYQFGTVQHIERNADETWHVVTDMNDYQANSVIVATGSEYKKLGAPGELDYAGRGVSYCAVCDGAFFKNQEVVVVGGGDSAIEEAVYLAGIVDHVTVVHRHDQLKAQPILQKRAFATDNIDFIWDNEVESINGDGTKVESVTLKNTQTGETTEHATAGVFIYIGLLPVSDAVADLGVTDDLGWIKTNEQMETSQPGLFAVGDVRQKQLRQITTAVGDAAIAGQNAYAYNESLKDHAE